MNPLIGRIVVALSCVFLGLALLSVTTSQIVADVAVGEAVEETVDEVVTDVVEPVDEEQTQLERDLAALIREHRALLRYVATVLRPWVVQQAHRQIAALPPGVPTPSLAPLPPVPTPTPIPIPDPIPSDTPTPDPVPTPEPSPSICLPIICEGGSP